MKTTLPGIILVLVLLYLAGTYIAKRNLETYYTQCAQEYSQQTAKSSDIHVAIKEIQACVDAKKGFLERIMITRTETWVR
jgi:uncharacterized protein YxeA